MSNDHIFEHSQSHPCYDEQAHNRIGRIHLPVAPKCNLSCNYCARKVSPYYHTSRPGLAYTLMQPGDCVSAVQKAIITNPSIEVVGISGPGEPLFNEETPRTLALISEHFPFLKLCVCTNGLLLPQKARILKELGVKSLTVTINATDPTIGSKISSFSIIDGNKVSGMQGAKILISRQLAGLKIAYDLGFMIKVNTVLIPGVNMGHVKDIAYEIEKRGAYIMNIMPLIPQGKFGSVRAPTCDELIASRESCESTIPIFRACKHCRADACGIPGLEDEEHGFKGRAGLLR